MDLRNAAQEILKKNEQTVVVNGRTYYYTVPSLKSYPFQWFWDSCFHAIVYAALGEPERAKEELRSLLTAQREDGFIPHVIFWDRRKFRRLWWHYTESRGRLSFLPFFPKPKTSEEIQPPVLAQAVQKIFAADGDKTFLEETVPNLNRYYRWLLEARDPDHDNLITTVSPFESGMDFSPAYDPVFGLTHNPGLMRLWITAYGANLYSKLRWNWDLKKVLQEGPFHVEDVGVNAILGLNLSILSRLNEIIGNNNERNFFSTRASDVSTALMAKCYDAERGAFFNLSGKEEQRFPVLTVQSLMPLILPELPHEIATAIVERHLKNKNGFWLPYPVPSASAGESGFTASGLTGGHASNWRGSSWVNTNWFLVHGLRQHGYNDLAAHIAEKTRELIQKNGFYEYFNPYTGEGSGAENFGWSTLVIDM